MKDQMSDLDGKQISAVQVTSSMDEIVEGEILRGKFSIIYISPQLLLKKAKWKGMLRLDLFQQRTVGFIVVRELLHLGSITISIIICRGNEFRVEFSHLGEVLSLLPPNVKIMVLTATATITLRSEVCGVLWMKDQYVVTVSPEKNVILQVSKFFIYNISCIHCNG